MKHATDLTAYVDDMEACVGDISSHRDLADRISRCLWAWSTPEALLAGFTDALTGIMHGSRAAENQDTARFVLTLADQPGQIMTDWSPSECEDLLTMDHRFTRALARGTLRRAGVRAPTTRLSRQGYHGEGVSRFARGVRRDRRQHAGRGRCRRLVLSRGPDGITAARRVVPVPSLAPQVIDAVLDALRPLLPGAELPRRGHRGPAGSPGVRRRPAGAAAVRRQRGAPALPGAALLHRGGARASTC